MKTAFPTVNPELREELDSSLAHYLSQLTDAIKADIANCNSDLYHGPIYFTPDGERASCFDQGAKAFDFKSACARISEALEIVDAIKVETSWNEETNESEYETVDGSRKLLIKAIVGSELAAYV